MNYTTTSRDTPNFPMASTISAFITEELHRTMNIYGMFVGWLQVHAKGDCASLDCYSETSSSIERSYSLSCVPMMFGNFLPNNWQSIRRPQMRHTMRQHYRVTCVSDHLW